MLDYLNYRHCDDCGDDDYDDDDDDDSMLVPSMLSLLCCDINCVC